MKEKKILDKNVTPVVVVDTTSLYSPLSLLRLKKEISKIKANEILQLDSEDPGMSEDIESWCNNSKNTYLGERQSNSSISYFVMKN